MKKIKEFLRFPRFELAYLKLTGFYVLIVMIISISFSVSLYRISEVEITRGLGKQNKVLRDLPVDLYSNGNVDDGFIPNFEQLRSQQVEESSNRLQTNLIYFNLLILIMSSIASYFMAKKMMRPIEDALEAQNRFTADASHELRTPLTALRSEIEVNLRDKKLNLDEAKKLLGSNLEEIGKLEKLSNDLLKLDRFSGNGKIKLSKVSLEECAAEAYGKVEKIAADKSIKFDTELSDIIVMGEQQSITELLIILLDNAIKYSPTKSKVSLKITQDKKMGVVEISDEGMGIKASDIPYIFNRFYRADSSRTRQKVEGNGLGLSIAKKIIELNDGEIVVRSNAGKGTTFFVKFSLFKS